MDETEVMARFRAWDDQLLLHDRLEIGHRRVRLALLSLLGVGFVLLGAVMAAGGSGADRVVGCFCVLLFGWSAVVVGRQAMRGGLAVVVTSREVGAAADSPLGGWAVPWASVRGARVYRLRGSSYVVVSVDPGWYAAWLRDAGPVRRLLARANRPFLGSAALAMPGQIAADTDLLAAWIDSRGTDFQRQIGRGPTAG
jgi:hypothetical protein